MQKFLMLMGISGSGKSSYAKALEKSCGYKVFSSDALREELFGNENDQTHNSEVFEELHRRILKALNDGEDCVYDATSLNRKRRIQFLDKLKKYKGLEKGILIIASPVDFCVARDAERARTVGRAVIERQVSQFQIPLVEEGWDYITVSPLKDIGGKTSPYQLDELLWGQTPHNCAPYHLETIETHMKLAYLLAKTNDEPDFIQIALKYHDIGKFFTRKWNEEKGRNTFYSHQNWSTYLYLCSSTFLDLEEKNRAASIGVATLISEHMEPHLSSWDKKKGFYGEGFRNLLELIAYYDDWASIKDERE